MKKYLLIVLSFTTLGYSQRFSTTEIENRVEELLQKMTLEEKIEMIGGVGFETKAIERLKIPSLKMTDGPMGVRWGKATSFPSGIMMAATFNLKLIEKVGSAIAKEVKAVGRHVILGPCVNIARIPMGGRNFESFGEDPYLTSRMAVSYINGVQKENVAATIKHFAVNNQEFERMFVNTIVDERTLNEIYFPHFKAGVTEAKVLCVMAAYNKLNGSYCSENDYLLKKTLKDKWGFEGIVMSDWGAVHSTEETFKNGLDLEMPTGMFLNMETLLEKFKKNALDEEILNDKVRRILRVMFKIGLFDKYEYDSTKLNCKEHQELARKIAEEGIVLLKNERNLLPLDLEQLKSVAVIGPTSNVAVTGGGGSSFVTPFRFVTPLEALKHKLEPRVKIHFAQGTVLTGTIQTIPSEVLFVDKETGENGLRGEYFDNKDLSGEPIITRIDKIMNFSWGWNGPFENFPRDNFSVRWEGYIKLENTGEMTIDISSDDGIRLYIDDKIVIDDWNAHAEKVNSYTMKIEASKFYKIKLEYYENGGDAIIRMGLRNHDNKILEEAIEAAKKSDVALIFVGTNFSYESEGFDRENLSLPKNQDELIQKIIEVNPNTVVILTTGSPVLMTQWIEKVPALIELWFAGEEIGNAIASVLLGEVNPSGKLPMTFPVNWEDCSAYNSYKKESGITRYDDGIFVGYRHFDKNGINPLFPFGFGLSYTAFEYFDLKINKSKFSKNEEIEISFKVKNTGNVKGKEVPQLYISDPICSAERPIRELKRFTKIELIPNEIKEVKFILNDEDFKFYDVSLHDWKIEKGEFIISIGRSSHDIPLQCVVEYIE